MQTGNACFGFCLLFCAAVFFALSCNHSTEVDEKGCEDNTEPFLGKLYFKINDVPTDDLFMVPGDTFGIYYEYVDYDCNLDGGVIFVKVDDEDWFPAVVLPKGTACSSDESEIPVGIQDVFQFFPGLMPGEHTFQTLWTDNCNIRSDPKSGSFIILEEEDDA